MLWFLISWLLSTATANLRCLQSDDLLGSDSVTCSRFNTECWFHYVAFNNSGKVTEGIERKCELRSTCEIYGIRNKCMSLTKLSIYGQYDFFAFLKAKYPSITEESIIRTDFCCCADYDCNLDGPNLRERLVKGLHDLHNPSFLEADSCAYFRFAIVPIIVLIVH
ncbi:unnamed protein product [Auanema sp. JU1783]|nr:unnamed protein product [Auanema sp. JU1783]